MRYSNFMVYNNPTWISLCICMETSNSCSIFRVKPGRDHKTARSLETLSKICMAEKYHLMNKDICFIIEFKQKNIP